MVVTMTDKTPPFDNCRFKFCDLPGQCKGEGKCHHPSIPSHQNSLPDCRLCTFRQTWGESYDPDCSLLSGCIEGSGFSPAPKIVLWKTKNDS